MRQEEVLWRTAHPLWREAGAGRVPVERPSVLRLAGEDFMEQLATALGSADGLGPLVARAETWRDPGAGLGAGADPTAPITLFQPTHGRYYVVTGALVCRRYGHPDRAVRTADGERVAMVLRRLVPAPEDDGTELAWIPAGTGGSWQPASPHAVSVAEERLALFPLTCACGTGRRRTWAGLVPVGRRETYEVPAVPGPGEVAGSTDPIAVLADPRLHGLEAAVAGLQLAVAPGGAEAALVRESLFFSLVDLATWLGDHLPGFLVPGGSTSPDLNDLDLGTRSWRAALVLARQDADALFEAGEAEPDAVAGLGPAEIAAGVTALGVEGDVPVVEEELFVDLRSALDDATTPAAHLATTVPGAGVAAPTGPGLYVTRLLYERPHCGPVDRQRLSAPSRPFRLAPFHDPDAPARPVRIVMPVDTSPGGLRKFPKNVSMVLSGELRKQMHQVSERTLRDGARESPPHIDFGMVCQLSIPIITICALLLLMVLVTILNIVFFWVPLFKICLPAPKGQG